MAHKMKEYYSAIKDTVLIKSENKNSNKDMSRSIQKNSRGINRRYDRNKVLGSSSVVNLKPLRTETSTLPDIN